MVLQGILYLFLLLITLTALLFLLLTVRYLHVFFKQIYLIKNNQPMLVGKLMPIRRILNLETYYQQFPPHFILLLLLNEDDRFWSHRGFNFSEMRESLLKSIQKRRFKGGSSISQQVVKNLVRHQSFGRPRWLQRILSKAVEGFATLVLEWVFSKEDILSIYLQIVGLGGGVRGFEGAAMAFFNSSPYLLTFAESLVLIAMLPGPGPFVRRQHELPVHNRSRFDYCLAYEKSVHALRVLSNETHLPEKLQLYKSIVKYSTPLVSAHLEQAIINDAVHEVHAIPDLLEKIEAFKKNRIEIPFFHSYLSLVECAFIFYFMRNRFVSGEVLSSKVGSLSVHALISLARTHKILQLGEAEKLSTLGLEGIEDAVMDERNSIERTNYALLSEAGRIIASISEASDAIIVFGEFNLVTHYYQNSWMRPFRTLSFLTDRSQADQVTRALCLAGFNSDGAGDTRVSLAEYQVNATTFFSLSAGFTIEALWTDEFDAASKNFQNLRLSNGGTYAAASAQQELEALVLRGGSFTPARLIEIQDVSEVLKSVTIGSIENILESVTGRQIEGDIRLALLMVDLLTAFKFPAEIGQQKPVMIRHFRSKIARIFDDLFLPRHAPSEVVGQRFYTGT